MFDCFGISTKVYPIQHEAIMLLKSIDYQVHCTICTVTVKDTVIYCSLCECNIGHPLCVEAYMKTECICRSCYAPVAIPYHRTASDS